MFTRPSLVQLLLDVDSWNAQQVDSSSGRRQKESEGVLGSENDLVTACLKLFKGPPTRPFVAIW